MSIASRNDTVTGEYVCLGGEQYYKISNNHRMPDFFMSLVGAGDHWMFVSSNGALTAGRRNPDHAIFPYASDDQITAARASSGPLTLIRFRDLDAEYSRPHIWEPFAAHAAGSDRYTRHIYKTPLGNKLVLEEINETQDLAFRYRWTFSNRFGFVRSCKLENVGHEIRSIELLDGFQNVLPHGVGSDFLMRFSNLANAYKKSEFLSSSGIGLFYLSSIPTDRAEPSEGLRTNVVWQTGLMPEATLLSVEQVPGFRSGAPVSTESEVRGRMGAYLSSQSLHLEPGESMEWHTIAELGMDSSDVIELDQWIQSSEDASSSIDEDVTDTENEFVRIVSSSDGIQCGENSRKANRHLSNTIFNLMRGGVPLDGYRISTDDYRHSVKTFNREIYGKHEPFFDALPEQCEASDLQEQVSALADEDLIRLTMEYLPLAFSRRHGDPTRPWNRFSIELEAPRRQEKPKLSGKLARHFSKLGSPRPFFSRVLYGDDQPICECDHCRWIQPLPTDKRRV